MWENNGLDMRAHTSPVLYLSKVWLAVYLPSFVTSGNSSALLHISAYGLVRGLTADCIISSNLSSFLSVRNMGNFNFFKPMF